MQSEMNMSLELARRGLWLLLVIGAPVVLSALATGLLVGLLQAATQIQEFTLSFVPKMLVVLLVLALVAPWMGEQLLAFASLALSEGLAPWR